MQLNILSICLFLLGTSRVFATTSFNVDEMPAGAEVTVPAVAKISIPVDVKFRAGSTDVPQTVRIVPVSVGGGPAVPLKLSIFDTKQDRVKYVQVAPGAPFLYSFKGLSSIMLKSELPKKIQASKSTVRLQLESDKPLTIGR